jgi:hypothetical protein
MLTEREAWLKIAEWFSQERVYVTTSGPEIFVIEAEGEYVSGLCKATSVLYGLHYIDSWLWDKMRAKIKKNRLPMSMCGYYWPENAEGDKQRVAFCKEQAEKCEI